MRTVREADQTSIRRKQIRYETDATLWLRGHFSAEGVRDGFQTHEVTVINALAHAEALRSTLSGIVRGQTVGLEVHHPKKAARLGLTLVEVGCPRTLDVSEQVWWV